MFVTLETFQEPIGALNESQLTNILDIFVTLDTFQELISELKGVSLNIESILVTPLTFQLLKS